MKLYKMLIEQCLAILLTIIAIISAVGRFRGCPFYQHLDTCLLKAVEKVGVGVAHIYKN